MKELAVKGLVHRDETDSDDSDTSNDGNNNNDVDDIVKADNICDDGDINKLMPAFAEHKVFNGITTDSGGGSVLESLAAEMEKGYVPNILQLLAAHSTGCSLVLPTASRQ